MFEATVWQRRNCVRVRPSRSARKAPQRSGGPRPSPAESPSSIPKRLPAAGGKVIVLPLWPCEPRGPARPAVSPPFSAGPGTATGTRGTPEGLGLAPGAATRGRTARGEGPKTATRNFATTPHLKGKRRKHITPTCHRWPVARIPLAGTRREERSRWTPANPRGWDSPRRRASGGLARSGSSRPPRVAVMTRSTPTVPSAVATTSSFRPGRASPSTRPGSSGRGTAAPRSR